MNTKILIISFLSITISNAQLRNDKFFQQYDYEMAQFIGMKYNPIQEILGEPYHSVINDTILQTRVHFYKMAVDSDSIDIQIHYDKNLWCNGFSFFANGQKFKKHIEEFSKDFIKIDDWLVTPNRYFVSISNQEDVDGRVFVLFKATIYPVILAQLKSIDSNLRKGTQNYSDHHIGMAEQGIREVYQSILSASTINCITESELKTLTKIYKAYQYIVDYNGIKISFIKHNSELYFELLNTDLNKLQHRSIKDVDFSQIQNLVAL